jgi:hypothetical protein
MTSDDSKCGINSLRQESNIRWDEDSYHVYKEAHGSELGDLYRKDRVLN